MLSVEQGRRSDTREEWRRRRYLTSIPITFLNMILLLRIEWVIL